MKKTILLALLGLASFQTIKAQCTVAGVAPSTSDPCTYNFVGTQMSAITYNWDFGDGNVSPNGTVFSHTYANSGTYTACFIGYDSLGGVCDSDCVIINVIGCFTPCT